MIIGIAIVVDELHKGPRLIFRYPSSVPSNILNDDHNLMRFHDEYLSMRFVSSVDHDMLLQCDHM